MKIVKNDEPWRVLYVRLLTTPPDEVEDTDEVLRAYDDLINEGFMRGNMVENEEGDIVRGGVGEVTLKGHLFADEQKRLIEKGSLAGQLKSGAGLGLAWVSAFLASCLMYYVTNGFVSK